MKKIISFIRISPDGFVAGPNGVFNVTASGVLTVPRRRGKTSVSFSNGVKVFFIVFIILMPLSAGRQVCVNKQK